MNLEDLEHVHWEYDHLWDADLGNYTRINVIGLDGASEFGISVVIPNHVEPHHPVFAHYVDEAMRLPVEGVE